VDYTAAFAPKVYDVRFLDEEGNQIGETLHVEHGNSATASDDLTKEGHTFVGWSDGTSPPRSGDEIESLAVTKSVDYKATFTPNVYDVSFYDENGVQIGVIQHVAHGQSATAPDDLTKEGHTFAGWSDGTSPQRSGDEIESLAVTGSVDYTATFAPKVYDIRFLDEEGDQIGEPQRVEYGKCAIAPDDLTKEGHTFAGWSNGTAEPLSGTEINNTTVTGNVNYTAEFTANIYDVRFIDEEGNQIGEAQRIEHGKSVAAPEDLVKEGCTFAGWNSGIESLSSEEVEKRKVTAPTDYTAVYNTNSYMVTFETNGITETKMIEFNNLIAEPNKPMREGRDFAGWVTDEGKRWDFDSDVMPARDITLHASWDIRKYTVTFYQQDGVTPIGIPQTVNWGNAAIMETAPDVVGHAFDQWTLFGSDESEADSLTSIKEDIKAVACYIQNGYTVTFVDDIGRMIGTDGVYYSGSATAPDVPEKEGYTFNGWNACFDNVTENITVQAQYTVKTYTVRFLDHDGGEMSVQTVNWNTAACEPAYPERDGYTFAGWDTAFDKVTSDLTVRAQYNEIPASNNNTAADNENYLTNSSSANPGDNADEIKLLNGDANDDAVTLENEAIPAAPNDKEVQSRSEPISLLNRVSLYKDSFGRVFIVVLCIIAALGCGISVWFAKVKKR
jgi:uncharacterized repeat protein (TIGR02543 family)